jgi:hypothetical protein
MYCRNRARNIGCGTQQVLPCESWCNLLPILGIAQLENREISGRVYARHQKSHVDSLSIEQQRSGPADRPVPLSGGWIGRRCRNHDLKLGGPLSRRVVVDLRDKITAPGDFEDLRFAAGTKPAAKRHRVSTAVSKCHCGPYVDQLRFPLISYYLL